MPTEKSMGRALSKADTMGRVAGGGGPCTIGEAELDTAALLLLAAERPLIVMGPGTQDCETSMRLLTNAVGAHTITRWETADYSPSIAAFIAFRRWWEADVVLMVGMPLDKPYMRWTETVRSPETASPYIIRLDSDLAPDGSIASHITIEADASQGVPALLEAVVRMRRNGQSRRENPS